MNQNAQQIDLCVNALMNDRGSAYTAGFLTVQLAAAVDQLPKTKQKMFIAALRRVVGGVVTVKVTNILSGKEVELPWDQVGGPCDPSTERYHSM